MKITEANLSGGCHVVILGAGASIASNLHAPEKHGLKLPSMNDLPDIVGLHGVLSYFPKECVTSNFEETYSNIIERVPDHCCIKVMNEMIYSYFSTLELPDKPTIYDYLVMSLRDKDVIATFNWNPFLYQAWWRNYFHGSSPQLVFLHGNVAIGYDDENDMFGWAGSISKKTGHYYQPTQLLFPVKHKDYHKDIFIRRQWDMLQDRLDKTKCNTNNVTVFGYSAPVTDIEARNMMKKAWGDVESRNMEQFEIIDVKPEKELTSSWKDFVHSHHYDCWKDFFDSSIAQYPRRTDEAYWCRFNPITPEEAFVEANPVPSDFNTLQEMWDWYQPLIDKELI